MISGLKLQILAFFSFNHCWCSGNLLFYVCMYRWCLIIVILFLISLILESCSHFLSWLILLLARGSMNSLEFVLSISENTRVPRPPILGGRGENLLLIFEPPVIDCINCFIIRSPNLFNKFVMFGVVLMKKFSLYLCPPVKQLNALWGIVFPVSRGFYICFIQTSIFKCIKYNL